MATGAKPFALVLSGLCRQCRRTLTTSPPLQAGHNKWSKVKHIKGPADRRKTAVRTEHAKMIALYSRLYGTDLNFNSQLVTAIALAKKASIPKEVIDRAIARGQGRTLDGASLETATLEAILPPNIALLAAIETDNWNRTFKDLRELVKKAGGRPGTTAFFFKRLGRVVFDPPNAPTLAEDQHQVPSASLKEADAAREALILDHAIEAGVEDLDTDEDGNIVAWTPPSGTSAVAEALSGEPLRLKVREAEIVWAANEDTKVEVEDVEAIRALSELLARLKELPEVQAVYVNATKGAGVSEEEWARVEENLDA